MITLDHGSRSAQQLQLDTIEAIADLLREARLMPLEEESRLEEDRAAFAAVLAADTPSGEEYEDLQSAEISWRLIAEERGVAVADDGEAGLTLIGFEAEVEAALSDENLTIELHDADLAERE